MRKKRPVQRQDGEPATGLHEPSGWPSLTVGLANDGPGRSAASSHEIAIVSFQSLPGTRTALGQPPPLGAGLGSPIAITQSEITGEGRKKPTPRKEKTRCHTEI